MSTQNKPALAIVVLTAIQCLAIAAPAQAGPLCDWLFGRNRTAYYVPTGTYMPTPQGPTVTAGYLPTTNVGYPPMYTGQPQFGSTATAFPPQGMAVTSYSLPTATQPALPVAPRYSAAYGAPSLNQYALPPSGTTTAYSPITGPATGNQNYPLQSAPYFWPSPPQQNSFTSWLPNIGSYFGTGNYYPSNTPYPTNTYTSNYWSSYRVPSAGGAGAHMYPPTTAGYPTAAPVTAGYPSYPSNPVVSGSPIMTAPSYSSGYAPNTSFSTNTYNVPVTYYRPIQSVDPTTGQSVTTMQGCQSYQTQVQRVPSYSLGGSAPAPASQCSGEPQCPPGSYESTPGYGTNQYGPAPNTYNPQAAPTNRPSFGNTPAQPNYGTPPVTQPNYGTPPVSPPSYQQQGAYPQSTYPQNGYPQGNNNYAAPPQGGNDQTPLQQPQLQPNSNTSMSLPSFPGTGASNSRSGFEFQPQQPSTRLDVKPIPAPQQYQFQYNTTDDRTARHEPVVSEPRSSTVAQATYKTIQWAVPKSNPSTSAVQVSAPSTELPRLSAPRNAAPSHASPRYVAPTRPAPQGNGGYRDSGWVSGR
ncbi:hypothetical protein Poly24_33990 [Rosistilla carotiformis]|uniref:Uncharacterized protein n=1 Tax=Rosistilla carotiformis TaxID=2528017 RepID=A0A518JVW6_9BACT|nr:hypothetical protein [Rosistilla carotiformis]QDV69682.1 hypothetical protein Poly24_33990 [Rosistilla carotiformis]